MTDRPVVSARWVVTGKVQGVGFRWFVREQARRWGARGSVRNRPDGSVEIIVAGSQEALAGLLAAVRRGPEGAVVTDVAVNEAPPSSQFAEPFSILRG
jgi:acylphosphatase